MLVVEEVAIRVFRDQEAWARVRRRGRARFVWGNCVAVWGGVTAALWFLAIWFMAGWTLPAYAWFAPVVFPSVGYLLGSWIWKINERLHA